MQSWPRIITALILVAVVASPAHAQSDADGLFKEGNQLFRSGLYHAALLRYREARAAGLETSLLHYNLGVVHYKLGEYEEAIAWLERSLESSALQSIASYNLGLVHRAAGRPEEARTWFERTIDSGANRRLRRLAESAAAASQAATRSEPRAGASGRRVDPREPIPERGKVGELRLLASARWGQDDNVYSAPAEAYVDLGDPGLPTVTPVVHSASFMPVDIVAEYVMRNEAGDTDFIFGYRFGGDFYDAEFSNANQISQRFDIGADIVLGETEKRRRTVDSAFFLRTHDETNFDPDDGIDREISGVDISDRFSFRAAGIEGEFEHELGPWTWGFDAQLEKRVYEDVPLVAGYDHEFYFTRAEVEYALGDKTSLSFGLRRYRRVYDQRLARDLNGDLLVGNALLQYDYRGAQLGISRRLSRAFRIDLDLLRLERIDEFQGYYDYTQDMARLRASYRPNRRFRLAVGGISRSYDYPNAFAFNEPTAGRRKAEGLSVELEVEYRVTSRLWLRGEFNLIDMTSTDPRAAYERTQSMLGLSWRR